ATFAPSHSSGFRSLLLKEEILKSISECGFEHPSKLQHELIPQVMRGTNINCHAKSGTGKTTICIIATLNQLEPDEGTVSVLVLCHSHNQVVELAQDYENIAKYMSTVKVATFCGDSRMRKNRGTLWNACPNIVIGTPGRIYSLAKTGALSLNKTRCLVLDECDQLFSN
ncbi:hypothetical protein PMAYCL1PPCAC_22325, partial [Pristionchus mayeri]